MAYNAPTLQEWVDVIQEHDLSETRYLLYFLFIVVCMLSSP